MWQQLYRTRHLLQTSLIRRGTRRWLSTTQLDPSIREFTAELAKTQPVFQIPPSSIRVLREPAQFYDLLLDMINSAERRIFLSSLYIGADEAELVHALSRRLREKPDLKLDLLLDLNRSTRPGKDSTARLLLPLLREHPSRVSVFMFRSPNLRGILAKLVPPRFNEGWGTWHAKIYGADDDVMISGANLNKSYFTDRQDRYIHFSEQTTVAQYCYDFMQTVTNFSYKLLPEKPQSANTHTYSKEDYTLYWPIPDTHPHHFNAIAETAFSDFQKRHRKQSPQLTNASEPLDPPTVLVSPIIQGGQFNVREEESVFQLLFRHLSKTVGRPYMDLTSGYFSLYKPYQDLVLKALNLRCNIIVASPKANGFYGSKGISGRIPEGYTLYEKRFMNAVWKAGRLWNKSNDGDADRGVSLNEWEKAGWTYHAKGVWLSPNSSSPPILTLFGSTNLNSRSAHIDTELSFLMVIPSEGTPKSAGSDNGGSTGSEVLSLRQELAREIENIRSSATEWKGADRPVRWTTKLIASASG
ncbi:hypothetical protein D9613_007441 [Agrocybe pediades]|uniref:CDP-diacylglycerol--glycerol-3-phosphate 3-phosphatidyltransferase n=1 Tax=Agrocybe pediades TaxID=84607 RepID=A0A8H4VN82_9AGAR|nr:hypothetical protein D9613_007441 [Agrocybe pediades]